MPALQELEINKSCQVSYFIFHAAIGVGCPTE